jgi:hypothetical protein
MATKAYGLPTPPPSPRANSHAAGRDRVRGFLPAAAERSDPQGTEYQKFGPGTPSWSAKATGSKAK